MTIDPRERLRRIDPAPLDVEPPSGALEAIAVIYEIERMMGMDTRDTTNISRTPSVVAEQIEPGAIATANDTPTNQAGKRRWSGALVAAAAFGVAVVVVGVAVLLATGDGDDAAAPASILAAYVEALNSGDVDAVMALYADDAVVKDHPRDFDDVATGVDEIRALISEAPLVQGSGEGMELFTVVVSGSTVTFHHRFFYGADGIHSGLVAGCTGGINDSMTVVDGKITVYDWGVQTRTVCP
jgi:hypothetical protein